MLVSGAVTARVFRFFYALATRHAVFSSSYPCLCVNTRAYVRAPSRWTSIIDERRLRDMMDVMRERRKKNACIERSLQLKEENRNEVFAREVNILRSICAHYQLIREDEISISEFTIAILSQRCTNKIKSKKDRNQQEHLCSYDVFHETLSFTFIHFYKGIGDINLAY